MKLVPMLSILEKTAEGKYAQGAFNITSRQQVEAVLAAHENLRSPAIVQVGNIAMGYLGQAGDMNKSTLEERRRGALNIRAILEEYSPGISVPVALHADHVKDLETIKMLLDSGFTSVMIDGSSLAFDANVELTREVVKLAHPRGVTVEGELGVLAGMEEDTFSERSSYTNPLSAVDFVRKTGVDCLALAYGTMHGVKKGKNIRLRREIVVASMENLRHEGLRAVLVSHGSSTVPPYALEDFNALGGDLKDAGGIPIDQLKDVIACGIGKINIDTDLRLCIARNVREFLAAAERTGLSATQAKVLELLRASPGEIDFRHYLKPLEKNLFEPGRVPGADEKPILDCMRKGTAEIVGALIVQFGSIGKANRIEALGLEERAARYGKA